MILNNDMKDILNNNNNVKVVISSVVKLLGGKKNEMVGNVKKIMVGEVELNRKGMYENKMLEINKDFVLSKRKWGKRVGDSCIIENKGNYYIELIYNNINSIVYMYNDEVIEKDKIVGLKEYKNNNDIGLRCVKVENIEII